MTHWDACFITGADQEKKRQYLSTSGSTSSANSPDIILYVSSSQYQSTTDVLTVDADVQKISPRQLQSSGNSNIHLQLLVFS